MLAILSIISPIYIIIALGFGLTRAGLFTRADMLVLGRFVINIALPAMLFIALSQREFGDIFNASYIAAYTLGSLLMLVSGYFWATRFAGLDDTDATFHAMGMSCSNSAFVGYPIVLLTFPSVAGVALALNLLVENLIVIPLLLLLAERARGGQGQWQVLRQSMLRMAQNPLIIGLVAGLLVSILEVQLPTFAESTITILSKASGALSLFVIGGSLVGLQLRGLGKRILPITLGKLVLHPVFVLFSIGMLYLLGLGAANPALMAAAALMAAMPMMGTYQVLAQKYGVGEFSAAALLMTTSISFFSLSSLLFILSHLTIIE